MKRQDFDFLVSLLKEQTGWEFDEALYFIMDKKITAFLREKKFANVEDLIVMLKSGNKPLISQVVEALTFSETSFFKNCDVFYKFQNVLLPILREKCRATKKINIWSLGCSTGQEAYSIALIFDKESRQFANWDINILGSDISSLAINKAQKGIYNNFEIQSGLNAQDIIDYFYYIDDQWMINDNIKNMVEFRRYNLLEKPIVKTKLEVIFCRNVLRYFAKEYLDNILHKIRLTQPRGGYLYLGKSEIVPLIDRYYDYDNTIGAYVAKGDFDAPIRAANALEDINMPSFVKPKNL